MRSFCSSCCCNLGLRLGKLVAGQIRAVNEGKTLNTWPWDEKPFELDIVTILDPPKELTPFDPNSYNSASYLW